MNAERPRLLRRALVAAIAAAGALAIGGPFPSRAEMLDGGYFLVTEVGADAGAPGYFLLTEIEAPDAGPDAGSRNRRGAGPDAGLDAGPDASLAAAADAGPSDACAAIAARIERRKAWLVARRQEQFRWGGQPDPKRGIPNTLNLWCQEHRDDEECSLGSVAIDATSEELAWSADKTPEDLDVHVILMRRKLRECQEQGRGPWWSR